MCVYLLVSLKHPFPILSFRQYAFEIVISRHIITTFETKTVKTWCVPFYGYYRVVILPRVHNKRTGLILFIGIKSSSCCIIWYFHLTDTQMRDFFLLSFFLTIQEDKFLATNLL